MEIIKTTKIIGTRQEMSGSKQYMTVEKQTVCILVFKSIEEIEASKVLSNEDKLKALNDKDFCHRCKHNYGDSNISVIVSVPNVKTYWEELEFKTTSGIIMELISNHLLKTVRRKRANGEYAKFDGNRFDESRKLDEDWVAVNMLNSFYNENSKFFVKLDHMVEKTLKENNIYVRED